MLIKGGKVLVYGHLCCKYLGGNRKWCLGVLVVHGVFFFVYCREVFVLFVGHLNKGLIALIPVVCCL